MNKKLIHSQLTNYKTYQMYQRQMLTLAENVFNFKNMPDYIDIPFLNKTLVRQGSIAFFEDDVMGVLALPYRNIGKLDVYGRPQSIEAISPTGYTKILKPNDFVIMYDNNGRYPIYLDICQYAERIAQSTRVIDSNLEQQKSSRIWQVPNGMEKTIRDLVNNIDGFESTILAYDNMSIDNIHVDLVPAPYVADKIDIHKEKDWNEFLRLIGVANMNFQKKERNIKDEVLASQGGTIASRFSRFEPREKAVKMINEKFGTNIEVMYYDGMMTSLDNGGDIDDISVYADTMDTKLEY